MPSRAANLIAFLSIVAISVSCQVYIYRQLRTLLRRDFPKQKDRLIFIAKCFFIYFNLPFAYLFFWRHFHFDASLLTQILMYPFVLWQALMIVWSAILIPLGVMRSKLFRRSATLVVKPIQRLTRRFFRPRKRSFPELLQPELLPATDEV